MRTASHDSSDVSSPAATGRPGLLRGWRLREWSALWWRKPAGRRPCTTAHSTTAHSTTAHSGNGGNRNGGGFAGCDRTGGGRTWRARPWGARRGPRGGWTRVGGPGSLSLLVLSAELVVLMAYLAVTAVIESNPIAQAVVGGAGRGPIWELSWGPSWGLIGGLSWGLREWLVTLWLVTVTLFATGGAYRQRLNLSVWEQLPALVRRAALALVALVALVDHLDGRVTRDAVAILGAAGMGSHLAVRLGAFALLREARQSGRSVHRTLVLGGGTVSFKVVELLEAHPELGLLPLGYVDDLPAPLSQGPVGWTYLGQVEDLAGVVERLQIQAVVVGFGSGSDALAAQALRRLAGCDTPQACDTPLAQDPQARVRPAQVFAVPRLFELGRRPIGQDHAGPIPLTRVRSASRRGPRWAAKRALDVVVALVALLAVSPLLAVTALGVRWECGRGRVFIGHNYIGRRGATVRLWRFRTARHGRGPGPVGRRLRGSWLGRLPMLWNVLVGDLSLVGPRPVQPQASQRLQRMLPHYEHRLQVRGGLIGPGAASPCPGDPPADEAVLYDTAYVENWGLWTDATVLLHGLRRLMGKEVPGVRTW